MKVEEIERKFQERLEEINWQDDECDCLECFSIRSIKILLSHIHTLEEGIKNIPTNEYEDALREGCGSNGAWDCFIEVLTNHKQKLLEEK